MRSLCVLAAGLAILLGDGSPRAWAQGDATACSSRKPLKLGQAHDLVQKSLLFVTATAVVRKGGVKVTTEGTGFFVSSNGEFLTVSHLYGALGDYEPETLQVSASLGSKEGQKRIVVALPVFHVPQHDLMKLRLQDVGDLPVSSLQPVCIVSTGELESRRQSQGLINAEALTSGFPKTAPRIADYGRIAALEGATHYWTLTGLEFTEGQSGSPVYFDDGRIFGLVKGTSTETKRHQFIIPIKHAYFEPMLMEAQQDWEWQQRAAKLQASATAVSKISSVEQIQMCREIWTMGQVGGIKFLLKANAGTMVADCAQARLDELAASKTEVITVARHDANPGKTGVRGVTAPSDEAAGTQALSVKPDQEAREIVETIIRTSGLALKIKVRTSEDPTYPYATTERTPEGENVIVVNPQFLSDLKGKSSWDATAVLAHEVGHFASLHHFDAQASPARQREMEMEADYYSGFIMAKLGATREQATSFFKTLPLEAFERWPGSKERVAAATRGWNAAAQSVTTASTSTRGASRGR